MFSTVANLEVRRQSDERTVARPNDVVLTHRGGEGCDSLAVLPHAIKIEIRINRDQESILAHRTFAFDTREVKILIRLSPGIQVLAEADDCQSGGILSIRSLVPYDPLSDGVDISNRPRDLCFFYCGQIIRYCYRRDGQNDCDRNQKFDHRKPIGQAPAASLRGAS